MSNKDAATKLVEGLNEMQDVEVVARVDIDDDPMAGVIKKGTVGSAYPNSDGGFDVLMDETSITYDDLADFMKFWAGK